MTGTGAVLRIHRGLWALVHGDDGFTYWFGRADCFGMRLDELKKRDRVMFDVAVNNHQRYALRVTRATESMKRGGA
jgi:hypothetical protein